MCAFSFLSPLPITTFLALSISLSLFFFSDCWAGSKGFEKGWILGKFLVFLFPVSFSFLFSYSGTNAFMRMQASKKRGMI